ncbi:MAG TPA: NADH-quinone oxidoreductase subunit G, partial [Actinobacteria bacterium]|nr:NADH-quinone oxidoreductase subunit G [Actinomycetota bacterium]
GTTVSVPKGTLVIRAAEQVGIEIPRFCDHPLLKPAGACRQCLVEVEGQRKPVASCTLEVADGMVVATQQTSPVADKAQQGVMELLLINHPLDCPVCDKGGECPLQNQAMSHGQPESRFEGDKRLYDKPVAISEQVLLDRERCVLCARCTRFSDQIAGDPFIELLDRGALQKVGIYEDEPFNSYFSGNTIQICPVGALTSSAYRFRARPFDLVSTQTACEHCASGCSLRTDHRRGEVVRRLAGEDAEVNEEWNCDKGRFAFTSSRGDDRITTPLVRDDNGELRVASWPEALAAAADGLVAARGNAGVVVGGRLTQEDAYAYAKFARVALRTNDIDFRTRPTSEEELDFLVAQVAGRGIGVTYRDLEAAPTVLMAGFEPEDESPIVFLRLHKAVTDRGQQVIAVAPYTSRGSEKLAATVLHTVPGGEAAALTALAAGDVAQQLRKPGSVIIVGERLALTPGALTAALSLATSTGASLAWVPRRAGERGALDAGAAPTLLPGGRLVTDDAARAEVAAVWGVSDLPAQAGRSTERILTAANRDMLGALIVAGLDIDDLADPSAARHSLHSSEFIVSFEVRHSEVTEHAHVVFPVPPIAERSGTFVNWEGRERTVDAALATPTMSEIRILAALADELDLDVDDDVALGFHDAAGARAELTALGRGSQGNAVAPAVAANPAPAAGSGSEAVLATHRELIDLGRGQDGPNALRGTKREVVVRLSAVTAAGIGAAEGQAVRVATGHGAVTLPLQITAMPDGVVWLPTNAESSRVLVDLRALPGERVTISQGGAS